MVFHHVHSELVQHGFTGTFEVATRWLQLGHYAVGVFIVVSGFSLMLPVAMSPGLRIEGGWRRYLSRRARRILPAYYVVLCGSLLLAAIWPAFRESDPAAWNFSLRSGAILSHLGLFHNLSPAWCYKIVPPMWSVATESQIYLLFPVLLLPLFRHCGGIVTTLLASALGIAIHLTFGRHLGWVCPWYLGLFAMGMTAALVYRPPVAEPGTRSFRAARRHAAFSMAALLGIAFQIRNRPAWTIPGDLLTGLCAAHFIAWAALHARENRRPVLVRYLECRLAIFLGDISYSLYLVHLPLITLGGHLLRTAMPTNPALSSLLLPVVALPTAILAAMILRRSVERPWIAV